VGLDFVGGAVKCLESPLFEQAHPLRRWMQTLLRRGAGGFRDVAALPSDHTMENDLGFSPSIIGKWEEKPLLSRADFSALTFKQGIALVQLMRAGSPRRDFIHLDQVMDEMPAELMDPDYVPAQKAKPAVNLAKEEEAIAA
jgi:hypothetical protein